VSGRRAIQMACIVALAAIGSAIGYLLGAFDALGPSATFYVCNDAACPHARDTNAGDSTHPWRTIERANRQTLKPGSKILFKGGDTFDGHTLEPASSGTMGAPVVYGSYGSGHAILKHGIRIPPRSSWITIRGLTIDGSSYGGARQSGLQGIAGSAAGYDKHVSILDNTLRNLAIGINGEAPESAFTSDSNWLIAGNTIENTGNSGIIVKGDAFTIEHNTIENTGLDYTDFGEHGIYLKAGNSKVLSNTIVNFRTDGVSVRYRDSLVEGNVISNGAIGVAWFQYDPRAGTSIWSANTITQTTEDAFYVSPSDIGGSTRESFVITNNIMSKDVGGYMDLHSSTGSYTVSGNRPAT
jgi:hypothetical protein